MFLRFQLLVLIHEVSVVNYFGIMRWSSCFWSNFWISLCRECDSVVYKCCLGFRIFGYIILRGYKWFYHNTIYRRLGEYTRDFLWVDEPRLSFHWLFLFLLNPYFSSHLVRSLIFFIFYLLHSQLLPEIFKH